jgi:hypothetical protein
MEWKYGPRVEAQAQANLLADRGSSRGAPAFFVAVPPHTKGGRHSGPLFPYLLVSENGEYRKLPVSENP